MESSEAVARDSLSAVEEVLNRTLEADIAALRVRGGHVYTAPLVRDGMNRGMQKSHEATLALERHKVEASHRVRVGDLNKFFDGQLVRVLNILAFPGRAMAISPPFRRWMQQTPFSARLMRRWQRCRNRPTQLKPR